MIFINVYSKIFYQIESKNKKPIDFYRSEDHLNTNGALFLKKLILEKLSI